MGTLIGHVTTGTAFLVVGYWQLFNHIRLHALNPSSYSSLARFPFSKFRYLVVMASATAFTLIELFAGPRNHQPLHYDWTIPSNHLHNFEHVSISLALLVFGAFAVILDQISLKTPSRYYLTSLLASFFFAQQFLIFHLHSTDHAGPEGQYHFFQQIIILVSLITTLMGISFPKSFAVSFVRSLSIFFQGVWFIVTGIMLWTPELLPKGCFLDDVDRLQVARCSGENSLSRAKSLINIEFSWYLTIITTFGMSFYLVLVKIYGDQKVEYSSLPTRETKEESDDIESQKKSILLGSS